MRSARRHPEGPIASTLRRLVLTLAVFVLWSGDSDLRAATITMVTQQPKPAYPLSPLPPLVNPTLRLTGMFETGDSDKLRDVLAKVKAETPAKSTLPLATLELSSLGGSLSEGIKVGELLRASDVVAVVRRPDICLSACALALLGGNARRPNPAYPADCNVERGARVAFHNFYLNRNGLREVTQDDPVASRLQGFSDARSGAALLVKYAADMGLPANFVAGLIGRPVEDFQYIETTNQFVVLNICPTGLTRPSQPVDQQATNICVNATGTAALSSTLEATAIAPQQAKQYMLERIQENMQSVKARGRLADQLASWSVMRVQEEIDKLYDDLRGAGLALPDIVGPTFEIGIRQKGDYRTACYVSLSPTEPDSYDVVVQGTRGLAEAPRQPPENARRLFLFERNDIVNPHAGATRAPIVNREPKEMENPRAPVTSGRLYPYENGSVKPNR
jgi:hypothetical protein